ncbi:MAG: leucine/isoleucine/valine transporter permease subunit [Actinobacteria bacterium]|nr:leucine/isoleucine/valine transporter permease subunit [Actinomycetota bacterium]
MTELLAARQVKLGDAIKTGLVAGIVAIFVSAIGMVQRFDSRIIFSSVTFSYVLLIGIFAGSGYQAARPPLRLEGYEAPKAGVRNVLAGLLAGTAGGILLALFILVAGTANLRPIFPNISPELVEILAFGRELGLGATLAALAAAVLGLLGGALQLVPQRLKKAIGGTFLWIVLFALLRGVLAPVTRGLGITSLTDLLYERQGLSIAGLVAVAVVVFSSYFFLAGRVRAARGGLERLPENRRRIVVLAGLAVVTLFLGAIPQVVGVFLSEVLSAAGIFLLMALGLNIVVGFAGLLDLGYVAFFAVGAYTTAVLTSPISPRFTPELTFWAALPFVILTAAIAGIMVGTPVLRMRGDYLAIVTLGFGEIARLLFLSDWLEPTFGAARGIRRVPDIALGPIVMKGPQDYYYAILLFVLLAAYVSWALQESRIGRAWMAMREDESVAEAMGVNIVAAKLWAFVIGAIIASFGGALFATRIGSVFPQTFSVVVSVTILVLVIVGGLASIPGVMLGALALVALPELLREFEQFRFLIYGALLIFMMLKRPEGLIPSRRRTRELHEEEVEQDAWLKAEAAKQEAN